MALHILTEEEMREGREKIKLETKELARKMLAGEDYKIEYFDLDSDEGNSDESDKNEYFF
jgi:DNA-dependent RNA polymerase auxiliary subunit epsilon